MESAEKNVQILLEPAHEQSPTLVTVSFSFRKHRKLNKIIMGMYFPASAIIIGRVTNNTALCKPSSTVQHCDFRVKYITQAEMLESKYVFDKEGCHKAS